MAHPDPSTPADRFWPSSLGQTARPPRRESDPSSPQVRRLAARTGRYTASRPPTAPRNWRAAGVTGAGSLAVVLGIVAVGGNPDRGSADAASVDAAATLSVGSSAAPVTAAGAPAGAALVVATTTAPACTNTYTVVAGDYWIRIADAASISLDQLLAANAATTATPLFPDQTVCLPGGVTVTTAAPRTTVAPKVTAAPKVTTAPVVTAAPVATTSGSR